MQHNIELTRYNFWLITANSTAAFVLAYLLIFYIDHFIKIALAGNFGYDIGFDWHSINYYIEPHEWTHDSVKLIYSSGPILVLIFGIISMVAFWSLVQEQAKIKILLVWITIHAFNFFFGGLLIGNIFKQGIGHVFNWLYLSDTTKMMVALVGFMGLLGTAYFMAKPVAITANSYFKKLDSGNFPFFITSQVLLPAILGTIICLLFFYPYNMFQELYSWISLGLIIIFISLRISNMGTQYYDEEDRYIRLSKILIVFASILVIGLRLLLNNEVLITW